MNHNNKEQTKNTEELGGMHNYQYMPLSAQFNQQWLERVSEPIFTLISKLYKDAVEYGTQAHTQLFYAGNDIVTIEPGGWTELTTGLDIQFPQGPEAAVIRDEYIGIITTANEQAKIGMSVLGGLHYVMRTPQHHRVDVTKPVFAEIGELVVPVSNMSPIRALTINPGDVIGQLTVMNYTSAKLNFQPRDNSQQAVNE